MVPGITVISGFAASILRLWRDLLQGCMYCWNHPHSADDHYDGTEYTL